ncbi:MAG: TonB-dependent receptor [Gammaproteobacteria bacterium]|nr:TonB-dependent receptor [Gammaproteobacteria bacterium]MCP5195957.1 TonB-dependent receptor [Gammaproteobacteria bacterium]
MMISKTTTLLGVFRKIEKAYAANFGHDCGYWLRLLSVVVCLLFTALSSLAEESSADVAAVTSEDEQWLGELMQVLDESTEIATKSRLNADYVPGTATVLQGRDLEALGMRTVWEALALIPGVMINQGDQGDFLVAVRGFSAPFNSGNIKVLLNSVPMSRDNSGLSSQALSLPIEQVDRIEFIRGPGAVLYGDYAYHGVLNILTYKQNHRAFTRVDEHGTTTLGGQYAYQSEDGVTRFSLNVTGLTGNSVEAPVGVDAQEDQATGIMVFAHRGFQFTAQAIDHDYQGNQEGHDESTEAFEVRQAFDLAANAEVNLYASYLNNHFEEEDMRFLGHTWEGGADFSWQMLERHHWLAQFSYTDTQIEEAFKAPPPVSRPNAPRPPAVNQHDISRRRYGVSLQDRYEASDQLSITAGLRFDHLDDLALNLVTPRLAGVWRLSEAHILKAQYAEGYRAPTFWELFPNNVLIGLEPETVATTELSYINRVADRVVRLTLFHSRLKDHISPMGQPSFDFGNFGASQTAGVELEWEQQWSSQLKSWFNLSYSDSRDGRVLPTSEATNEQDASTTDWLGNLALFYRPTDRMLLTAYWNYISKRHAQSVDSVGEHRVAVTMNLFDVWTKGLTLRLGVRNLLQAEQRSLIGEPIRIQVTDFPDRLVWGQISYDF